MKKILLAGSSLIVLASGIAIFTLNHLDSSVEASSQTNHSSLPSEPQETVSVSAPDPSPTPDPSSTPNSNISVTSQPPSPPTQEVQPTDTNSTPTPDATILNYTTECRYSGENFSVTPGGYNGPMYTAYSVAHWDNGDTSVIGSGSTYGQCDHSGNLLP